MVRHGGSTTTVVVVCCCSCSVEQKQLTKVQYTTVQYTTIHYMENLSVGWAAELILSIRHCTVHTRCVRRYGYCVYSNIQQYRGNIVQYISTDAS